MEPKSNMFELQPETRSAEHRQGVCRVTEEWRRHLSGKVIEPRLGQEAVWTLASEWTEGDSHLAVLPTGYGKTIAAVGAYGILKSRNICNRMLVLVPSDQQRTQWADQGSKFIDLGVDISGITSLDVVARDIIAAQRGTLEVFVASYQSLYNNRSFLEQFMRYGSWFVVVDESHHVPEGQAWCRTLEYAPRAASLYLTATPFRSDNKILAGIETTQCDDGSFLYVPSVEVTIRQALEEEAIRWPKAFAYEYKLGVITKSGEQVELRASDVASTEREFSAYEAKMQLRYNPNYIHPIIVDAVEELDRRNARDPGEHQMLVHAMTQNHAKAVAQAINDITGYRLADWIGVDRPGSDDVMQEYLDNRLPCLVQVGKAGEGFDNKRCSVGVFLHLFKSKSKILQQLGRHMRRNSNIQPFEQDTTQMFVGYDSDGVIDAIRTLEAEIGKGILSNGDDGDDGDDDGDGGSGGLDPMPSLSIVDVEFENRDLICPKNDGARRNQADVARAELKAIEYPGVDRMSDEDVVVAWEWVQAHFKGNDPKQNAAKNNSLEIGRYKELVKDSTRTLMKNVLKICGYRTKVQRKPFEGIVMKAINKRWKDRCGSHDEMSLADFKAKLQWLFELGSMIESTREVPAWLRVKA